MGFKLLQIGLIRYAVPPLRLGGVVDGLMSLKDSFDGVPQFARIVGLCSCKVSIN